MLLYLAWNFGTVSWKWSKLSSSRPFRKQVWLEQRHRYEFWQGRASSKKKQKIANPGDSIGRGAQVVQIRRIITFHFHQGYRFRTSPHLLPNPGLEVPKLEWSKYGVVRRLLCLFLQVAGNWGNDFSARGKGGLIKEYQDQGEGGAPGQRLRQRSLSIYYSERMLL